MDNRNYDTMPLISIVIPCRNEEKYISAVLENIVIQDYPREKLEVFVIDGMSTDGTKTIINQFCKQYPYINYVENKNETVPFALNIGIKKSKGMIMIMGAHAVYPPDYVKKLAYWSKKLNAENVGAVMRTMPANSTKKAISIAKAMSVPFGVGNAYFRTGSKDVREVDTVTFGFYKREVFEDIGLFDEGLTRNQDDELNARLLKNGGKIYLIPDVEIKYFARAHFKQLWMMFFQYGYFKPLVGLKLGKISTVRQVVPPIFTISIVLGLFMSIFFNSIFYLTCFVIGIYLSVNLLFSLFKSKSKIEILPFLVLSFTIMHFSYGLGYSKGIYDFIFRKLHTKKVIKTAISR